MLSCKLPLGLLWKTETHRSGSGLLGKDSSRYWDSSYQAAWELVSASFKNRGHCRLHRWLIIYEWLLSVSLRFSCCSALYVCFLGFFGPVGISVYPLLFTAAGSQVQTSIVTSSRSDIGFLNVNIFCFLFLLYGTKLNIVDVRRRHLEILRTLKVFCTVFWRFIEQTTNQQINRELK